MSAVTENSVPLLGDEQTECRAGPGMTAYPANKPEVKTSRYIGFWHAIPDRFQRTDRREKLLVRKFKALAFRSLVVYDCS